jgi:hypothetical protein
MANARILIRNLQRVRRGRNFTRSVGGAVAIAVSVLWCAPPPASAGTQPLPAAQPVPGTSFLTGVSCPSTTFCVAIGYSPAGPMVVPITNGSAGTPEGIPGYGQPGTPTNIDLNGVTCTSKVSCLAVGTGEIPDPPSRMMGVGVIVPITRGVPGAVQQVSGNGQIGVPDTIIFSGVACSSPASCVAVGWDLYLDGVAVPITDGVAGNEVPVLASQLNAVSCHANGVCLAVGPGLDGGGVVVPLRNGAIGNGGGTVMGGRKLSGITCRTDSTCVAVGGASVIAPLTRTDLGRVNPVTGVNALEGVACSGALLCLAVGHNASNEGAMVRITSATPGIGKTVPDTSGLNAVACPGPDSCIAVGQDASNEGVIVTIPLSPEAQ